MIISASARTDIPALYADWFIARLEEGSVGVTNPFNGKIYGVDLRPESVTAFQFWTRNPAPFTRALNHVKERGNDFALTMTITGYPRAIEAATPATGQAIQSFQDVSRQFGADRIVWRYDPVLISSLTNPDWHIENFTTLARALRGYSDEVVLSFAQIYQKSRRNLDRAAILHKFTWSDPDREDKKALLARLAEIAAEHGFRATLCSQPDLISPGLEAAACIDLKRLERFMDLPEKLRIKGTRPGCFCAESRDIGFYDSCSQGCNYCYAVRNFDKAKSRMKDIR